MRTPPFDILKREQDGSFIWVEAAVDLQTAKARLEALAAHRPGEYFVFDQKTHQIVAKIAVGVTEN